MMYTLMNTHVIAVGFAGTLTCLQVTLEKWASTIEHQWSGRPSVVGVFLRYNVSGYVT